MSLSNDYMLVLDEIRQAKKVSIADLCQDIITERTYYRMMKSIQVRTDIFARLTERIGVDFTEFIHYAVFVKKSDSRFKFIFRVHTKFYRDIKEHYEAMLNYEDPSEELSLLIKVYIKTYEYESKKISQSDYEVFLNELIPALKTNESFNIYLFTIQLIVKKALPNCPDFPLKEMADMLYKEEFGYSVILVAICYDELLAMLLKSQNEDESMRLLMQKFETLVTYFPSRYFLMRYHLYQAYLGKINQDQNMMNSYLYKYIINALSMVEVDEYQDQMTVVSRIFDIDVKDFIFIMTKKMLY